MSVFLCPKRKDKTMKKKIICTALATTMLLSTSASAAPWQMRQNQLIFDSEIKFIGNVTLAHNGDYKPIPLEEVKN